MLKLWVLDEWERNNKNFLTIIIIIIDSVLIQKTKH